MLAGSTRCDIQKKATYEVRVVEFVQDLDVLKLDVEELINGFEGSFNCDVVLEFDGDFMVHKSLEEAVTLKC
jgi:hypothetical protein